MKHSAEKEIQQFAMDKSVCNRTTMLHIENCASCMVRVRNYQLIFSEIKKEPKVAFDFDLTALLMPKLHIPERRVSPDRFITGFLILFVCCCVGVPIFLFGQYVLNMFSGIPTFFIYATTGSASLILVFKILDMYRKYHRQMRELNFT